jgi:hypothetical protein
VEVIAQRVSPAIRDLSLCRSLSCLFNGSREYIHTIWRVVIIKAIQRIISYEGMAAIAA